MNDMIRQMALQMIAQNPNVQNNPNTAPMINAIQNNDAKAGMELAMNICKTFDVSPEEGVSQAKSFFGLK